MSAKQNCKEYIATGNTSAKKTNVILILNGEK
jgi:hypothetical protein